MSANPYAPPSAVVADVIPDERAIQTPFFAVSIPKLIVMCLCSFTFYEVYWFYRNWKRIQEREGGKLSPVLRAIFGIFFCYSLFLRMRDFDNTPQSHSLLALHSNLVEEPPANVGWRLPAGALAIGMFAANALWRLPDAYSFLGFLTVGLLVVAQIHVNRLNRMVSPGHYRNSRITGWNWLLVIPGGLFFLLGLTGLLLPEQP